MPTSRIAHTLRGLALAGAALVVLFLLLYQFAGLRYVPSGSGMPGLGFLADNDEQAAEIERHRAAQRLAASTPGAAAPLSPSGSPGIASSEPGTTPGAAPAGAIGGARAGRSGSAAASAPYWTDLRGPARDGRYEQRPILREWPATGLQPMWRQPLGGGYASFVAADGRAFTIEQRGRDEVVAAYDIETGRELWTNGWRTLFQESMGGDGPRATPTWSEGLLYALGAMGELRCLDAATGRVVWRVNILEDNGASNLQWGMSASPLIVGDTVIVLPGGPNGRSVAAYDRRTGRRAWSALDDRQAYASPMVARLAGRDQLIVFTASRLVGLVPNNGDLLWSYPWRTTSDINVAQPIVVGENRVFVSAGYDVGAAVIELEPRGASFDVREVWRNNRMKNKFTSSVLHDGFIYGLDEAILACIDAATGQLKWKGGRYGYGQILLAGDRIIVLAEDGDLVLVAASPGRHEELGRFSAVNGKTWNHLALEDGRLLVRNLREMTAFDLRTP